MMAGAPDAPEVVVVASDGPVATWELRHAAKSTGASSTIPAVRHRIGFKNSSGYLTARVGRSRGQAPHRRPTLGWDMVRASVLVGLLASAACGGADRSPMAP